MQVLDEILSCQTRFLGFQTKVKHRRRLDNLPNLLKFNKLTSPLKGLDAESVRFCPD